ncbi:hypothetical protein KP79_PYT05780 [Mizuhopecten yessoensis]|uniref:Transmembrane protein n=1 Tax=Mizuhopecten yessoensis TaxID=6573 RepID=A0A210QVA8_MIZYE|nr:hypothetical protein KP79_PYT05780 [Mizuhopecten yessoensis]
MSKSRHDIDKDTVVAYHDFIQGQIKGELNGVNLGPGRTCCLIAGVVFVIGLVLGIVGILVITLRMRHVYLWDWNDQFLGPAFIVLMLLCVGLAVFLIVEGKRRANAYRRDLVFRPIGDYGVAVVHKSRLNYEEKSRDNLKSGTTPHQPIQPKPYQVSYLPSMSGVGDLGSSPFIVQIPFRMIMRVVLEKLAMRTGHMEILTPGALLLDMKKEVAALMIAEAQTGEVQMTGVDLLVIDQGDHQMTVHDLTVHACPTPTVVVRPVALMIDRGDPQENGEEDLQGQMIGDAHQDPLGTGTGMTEGAWMKIDEGRRKEGKRRVNHIEMDPHQVTMTQPVSCSAEMVRMTLSQSSKWPVENNEIDPRLDQCD